MKTVLTDVDCAAILQLPTAAFVASSVHRTCLTGTREAVLQTIYRWAGDITSDKPIFWLCDIAGSGKSTVAMSAADAWKKEGVLGGQFFFSLTSSEGSTTDKFCSTIARDLVDYIPKLAPHVAGAVKRHPSLIRSSLQEQFRMLVIDPLHHLQGRVILVVDALDECQSGSQRRELVEMLSTAVREAKNLKIFMTSRPDPVIQAVLGSLSIKSKLEDRLHDVHHRDNIDDIATYIQKELNGVLPEAKRLRLVEKANGLFIWASTACRMLSSETTLDLPESIYDRLISVDQTGEIDDVYKLVFERMDPKSHTTMSSMLALLLAAFEPLSTDDLDDIFKNLGHKWSSRALVQNLGSVLSVDPSTHLVQFRHPTLVEYLRRCSLASAPDKANTLHLDLTKAHGQAASWCLKRLMSRTDERF
ncbi:related to archipelago beta form (F-box-WD40 repeat protein) [Serendipita indica DSM 11827]|uniref:Related to archipelago beta form (F-box-WD40 repeat protein) n=1 Tax=Serendipita indica (strain DSM 11827) TaxID=1109443 RepID=G4U058_SERID|nr:related to archipelago beta form (F-box-WD40 repeat protein) [Serendipita indica DSM 11827]